MPASDGCAEDPQADAQRGAVGLGHHVEEGDLADHCGNTVVEGGRGEGVPCAHGGSECRDPAGVDAREGAREGDRRRPVLELAARVKEVRLTRAVTEAAVVEDQCGNTGLREPLGKWAESVPAGAGEAVRHDDDRGRVADTMGGMEPCRATRAAREKVEILATRRVQCVGGLCLHPSSNRSRAWRALWQSRTAASRGNRTGQLRGTVPCQLSGRRRL